MYEFTFVSTVHKENGKCNAVELCNIIEKVSPEVIFLEALNETYSNYQKSMFSEFGIYHKRLEINVIQKYGLNNSFEYIPVLDNGLSDTFDEKYGIVSQYEKPPELLDNFISLASEYGFEFLNSIESINLQEQMRRLESQLIDNNVLEQAFILDSDEYENSMIRNICLYSKNNHYNSAIFMCGVAHRKSILQKINESKTNEELKLNWKFL